MRLIDADDFENRMYREVFEKDTDMQKWDSGCWMRYKLFENVLKEQPTIELERTGKWILCSETTDIPDHEILACDKYGELMFGYLWYEDEQWLCETDGCMMYDPIAWREPPEPYKEECD